MNLSRLWTATAVVALTGLALLELRLFGPVPDSLENQLGSMDPWLAYVTLAAVTAQLPLTTYLTLSRHRPRKSHFPFWLPIRWAVVTVDVFFTALLIFMAYAISKFLP